MTKKQTIELFAIFIAAYPNFDKFKDDSQVEGMINIWASIFSDDDAAIVGMAAKKHIATNKWPPSIAEIRDIMTDITHPDLVPPDLAWSAVADLLYAHHSYGPHDLYAALPPLVARAVETIGWHTLYELHRGSYAGNRDGMDRVAFMDLYKPAYDRARSEACCPASLNANIQNASRRLSDGGLKLLDDAKGARAKQDDFYRSLVEHDMALLDSDDKVPALPDRETEGEP